MAAMEGVVTAGGQDQQQPPPARVVELLNPAVQQQLNLESVKTRTISLFKAISRILEDFNTIGATNAVPKWQDILGQFSMVNLEFYNIVEDIKKVSKAFVVYPKNVNAENAIILPVMLSSKLLPEMEIEDNTKKEQLLHGMQSLPVTVQIDKLKNRIDMIGAACERAEKIIADARKGYFSTRQGPIHMPTTDKVQTAKIQEQENLLRSAVNHGEVIESKLLKARMRMQQKYLDQFYMLYDDFNITKLSLLPQEVCGVEALKAFSGNFISPYQESIK